MYKQLNIPNIQYGMAWYSVFQHGGIMYNQKGDTHKI